MSEIEELRAEVAQLREQVEMEAGLRASQDRDLSRISTRLEAARNLIQAVALTQSEHTELLREQGEQLRAQGEQLVSLRVEHGAMLLSLRVEHGALLRHIVDSLDQLLGRQ